VEEPLIGFLPSSLDSRYPFAGLAITYFREPKLPCEETRTQGRTGKSIPSFKKHAHCVSPDYNVTSFVKIQWKHSVLCLLIALCAFCGSPALAHAASKGLYFTHVTDAGRPFPVPSKQNWAPGNDVPSCTKTYHSPDLVLSACNRYPHHQDFFVVSIHLSLSPLSHLTYFRSRPRDPPGL